MRVNHIAKTLGLVCALAVSLSGPGHAYAALATEGTQILNQIQNVAANARLLGLYDEELKATIRQVRHYQNILRRLPDRSPETVGEARRQVDNAIGIINQVNAMAAYHESIRIADARAAGEEVPDAEVAKRVKTTGEMFAEWREKNRQRTSKEARRARAAGTDGDTSIPVAPPGATPGYVPLTEPLSAREDVGQWHGAAQRTTQGVLLANPVLVASIANENRELEDLAEHLADEDVQGQVAILEAIYRVGVMQVGQMQHLRVLMQQQSELLAMHLAAQSKALAEAEVERRTTEEVMDEALANSKYPPGSRIVVDDQ